jgi:hypothetical protein
MLTALERANPIELVFAACCFAAAIGCSAASWRSLLAPRLAFGDAVARYGVGSLVNTFAPARAGDAVRVGLFARVVSGGILAVAGAVAIVGTARWLALAPLAVAGGGSKVSPLALLAPGVIALPLAGAWVLARRGCMRAHTLVAPLRAARIAVLGWVCGTLASRVAATTLAGTALGIPHPVAAALLVVPALELAGVVSLGPANIAIAGGAAGLAFHAGGVPMHAALAAGLALHAMETGAGVVVGAASAVALRRGRNDKRPGQTRSACASALAEGSAATLRSLRGGMGRHSVSDW